MKKLKSLPIILLAALICTATAQTAEWTKMDSGTTIQLQGIWGNSASDIFVVGESGIILHYDGAEWQTMNSGTTFSLEGIWGSSGSDVYATGGDMGLIGGGIILHYDGKYWTIITPSQFSTLKFYATAWGRSDSDVYIAGGDASALFSINGIILHYDGTNWTQEVGSDKGWNAFESLWGTAGSDIFASGGSGTIVHYDGDSWQRMNSGTTNWLSRVWCDSSGTEAFAVGQNGTIVHYDGDSWQVMDSGTSLELKGVWGRTETDVFAVGWNGTILHYNGNSWQTMDSGVTNNLYTVWGNDTEVFAVGEGGTIVHYSEGTPLGPTPPSLKTSNPSINTWTNNNTVTITWNPGQDETGVAGYSYLLNTAAISDPDNTVETTQTQFTSPLADGDNHYFHIRTVNNNGEVSQSMHLGPFFIDTVLPQNGSVIINNGDEKTLSPEVTLTLSAEDTLSGVSKMAFSNDNLNWSSPINYAETSDWTLVSGEGERTVYARFSDAAGNQTTAAIMDEISIDANSPGRLILVAGGASHKNTLWNTTQELSTTVYRISSLRGFRNADIYFMCPVTWIDFNGDGENDHVTDCPPENEDRNLEKTDISNAITNWAVQNHKPGTPLFIWLIDHGYPDDGIHGPYFMIAPGQLLYAGELDDMLDTYENETGGQVILVNESCYSGQFLSYLKKNKRVIITVTADKVVNYDNLGTNSFTHIFLQKLFENNSIKDAFDKTTRMIVKFPLTWNQSPRLDDNGDGKYDATDGLLASNIRLGTDSTMGAPLPDISSVTSSDPAGTAVSFTVTTNAHMKRVWGTVQPPGYVPDMSGDYQKIELEAFDLMDNDNDLVYEGAYNKFNENGRYIVTFYAKDQFGNTGLSDPVEIRIGTFSPGDMNNDGEVDMGDAVLVLKIISGLSLGQMVNLGAGVGSDKIGLGDAVFVLQKTAEIR